MKALVTGSSGFIAGYLIEELLAHGHEVIGIDNLSKYGPVKKSYDNHSNYRFVQGDCKDIHLMKQLSSECEQVVALAAMIGGISYFHQFAYDLIAENERILANTFDAAIDAFKKAKLQRVIVISSSMVFENALRFPSREGDQMSCPPPSSTYGFQKLATEYFAKGAWEQYHLPYTIIRPFNCVGIGEKRALLSASIPEGNKHLALSHVVPDLVLKILQGQDPLEILGSGAQIRHYTYGGDIARGIRLAMESPKAINQDFNISTAQSTTVMELAQTIWEKIYDHKPFRYVLTPSYIYDVQKRIPDVSKAKNILGFEASTTLDQMLDEVIPWIRNQMTQGTI